MAIDHWWLGTTDDDHAVAANWSTAGSGGAPGVSVPGTGDEVMFDGNGNNPCTLTANLTLLHLTTEAGYTSKLDLAIFNLIINGNTTLDQAGEFDCGSSTMTHSGDFDCADVGTFTKDASNMVFTGLGNQVMDAGDIQLETWKLTKQPVAT